MVYFCELILKTSLHCIEAFKASISKLYVSEFGK